MLPFVHERAKGELVADDDRRTLTYAADHISVDEVSAFIDELAKSLGWDRVFERWLLLGTKEWKHITSVVSSMFLQ